MPSTPFHTLSHTKGCAVLTLVSPDGTNCLGRACLEDLIAEVEAQKLEAGRGHARALIITGNEKFFSAGADLNEIARLTGPEAFEFSRLGQRLMLAIDRFPVPVIAAVRGYCMGGALDLALSCDLRMAAPNAVFGHRGAALGLMTGWGGTQRLPRLIGKTHALEMFLTASRVPAAQALSMGLVNLIADDPLEAAISKSRLPEDIT